MATELLYGFEVRDDEIAADVSGNNYNGTFSNFGNGAGRDTFAYYGDGAWCIPGGGGGNIQLPTMGWTSIINELTMMFWAYPFSLSNANMRMLTWALAGDQDFSWQMYGAGFCRVRYRKGGTFYSQNCSWNGNLATNTWCHLCFTFDGTTVRTYKDGLLADTQTGVQDAPWEMDRHGDQGAFGSDGKQSLTDNWNGYMDEIKIFSHWLTEAEVQTERDTPIGTGPQPTAILPRRTLLGAGV